MVVVTVFLDNTHEVTLVHLTVFLVFLAYLDFCRFLVPGYRRIVLA